MIPRKLYIPTSTLNFNNILASESISPAGFYSVRGFGYKRFEKVEPNNLDKRILLYEKFPIFNIYDKELENEPLVIEVDTNTISEDIIQVFGNGVYFSEATLYLNPFSTTFYFRNEAEKRSVLSKVEQSLNTKMVVLYQNHLRVKSTDIESFDWQYTEITDTKSDFAKHISKDRLTNKLKGLLYAYLLGANKYLPFEIVALKRDVKELRNVISAVITSSNGSTNYSQEKQIAELSQSINNAFYKAEGLNNKLQEIISEKIEKYSCDNFEVILKNEGLYDFWFQKQGIKPSFQLHNFNFHSFYKNPYDKKNEKDNRKAEDNQKYFDSYFAELDSAIKRYVRPQSIDCSKLPHIQHFSRVSNVPEQKDFLVKLFNEFLSENWNSEEFLSSRLEFATAGGKLFKEELQDNWENSKYKTYINDLRNNLASHTPFELDTDNLTLKSFASFCQKGEEDIDKLEDYLISNSIGDFRIAFSLWGIVFGFANMPKTLTNELFMSDDLEYISKVYKFIFKQIHGIELEGKIEKAIIEKTVFVSKQKPEPEPEKQQSKQSTIKPNTVSLNQEEQNQGNSEELNFRKNLKGQKIKQEDKVIEMWKDNHFLINDKLFVLISKIPGIGDKTSDKIKKAFGFDVSIKERPKEISTNSLFGEMRPDVDSEFYNDSNVMYYISDVIVDKEILKNIKTEIDWIQKVHKDGGYKLKSGDFRELKDHSNLEVINHFENNTKKKIDNHYSKLSYDTLNIVVNKLKSLYLNDE